MDDFLISICMLSLNHIEITQKCLETLIKTEFPGKTEIILVDNGSADGTPDYFLKFQNTYSDDDLRIILLLNRDNRGCTGGRNQACKLATGKYIVILDNDVEIIQTDWLKKLLMFYETQKNIGIIGPKMLYPETPHKIQQIGLGVTKHGKIGYWGQGKDRDDPEYCRVKELQGYPAACWLLRRSLFEEVGYFDDIYYPVNLEDVDFCYRIREKGYKILYYPDVEMYHHEHITTKNTENLSFIRVTLKNGQIFKERWHHMFEQENGMQIEDIHWEH